MCPVIVRVAFFSFVADMNLIYLVSLKWQGARVQRHGFTKEYHVFKEWVLGSEH